MAEILVRETQNGGTVGVAAGDTVAVRLPENPTTGYRWQVDALTGLTLVADEFSPRSPAPGAGGERELRFIAPATGVFHIQATLRRAWEVGAAPQAQFRVTIQVR
jgi:inhibitor of cysteine peptidase